MATEEHCSGCAQRHDCKSIYGTLGKAQGPSVVRKVFFVFLFPLMVFLAAIAGLDYFFKERIASAQIRAGVIFILAALAGVASAGLVGWAAPSWRRPSPTDPNRNLQNETTVKDDV
ncbi:MAG TPA: hypothetical protein PLQ45_05610 [Anaerohalosphaeraceae bacterium]|jgi:hypothetical protein|nr:hypothetical protein [Anaerohalosphaeraceae bacterium]